jgi:hypothetical protein
VKRERTPSPDRPIPARTKKPLVRDKRLIN